MKYLPLFENFQYSLLDDISSRIKIDSDIRSGDISAERILEIKDVW